MYFGFFMRLLLDPFGALKDLLCALSGTFLLRNDNTLAGCFKCLHNSPLGIMGDGGMSCLLPFSLICMINGIMNSIGSIVLFPRVENISRSFRSTRVRTALGRNLGRLET